MKRTDPMMKIRLPPGLKEWIASAAEMNRRSQNAEIVFRLEASKAAELTARPESAATEEEGAAPA